MTFVPGVCGEEVLNERHNRKRMAIIRCLQFTKIEHTVVWVVFGINKWDWQVCWCQPCTKEDCFPSAVFSFFHFGRRLPFISALAVCLRYWIRIEGATISRAITYRLSWKKCYVHNNSMIMMKQWVFISCVVRMLISILDTTDLN